MSSVSKKEPQERRKFIKACPIEACKGFLSTQWKCGLCNIYTCSKCHVPKCDSDEHVCNPDDVATAELLKTDTRPCPQCATGITKIDGCDQMWCIECHCAFSWSKGTIETGRLHNPHYFEFHRKNGTLRREVEDVQCGGLRPDEYHGIIRHWIRVTLSNRSKLARLNMGMTEIDNDMDHILNTGYLCYGSTIGRLNEMLATYNTPLDNLENRIKYMTDEIDEAQFKMRLFRATKQHNLKIEYRDIIQMVVLAMSDMLNRFIELVKKNNLPDSYNITPAEDMLSILSEMDGLIVYANQCLFKVAMEYNVTPREIFTSIQNTQIRTVKPAAI
jgi:hypothetical protein